MSLSRSMLYRFDEFELNPVRRTLLRDGSPVALSPKAFEVLAHLVANPARVVTKEELLKAVWPESFVEEGNLAQHISGLRKAFADRADYIVTVPGRGYQFAANVREESPPAPLAQSAGDEVAHSREGDFIVQRVRERTRMVVEETTIQAAPTSLALGAPAPRSRIVLAAAFALLCLAAFAGWRWFHRPVPSYREIVLADFAGATADSSFDQTLKRALEIDLEQSPYLDVLSERGALGTLQMMGRKPDTPISSDVAREICVRTNRQVLLAGNVASVGGGEYLVTLEASDCNSGKLLATAKAQAPTKEKVLGALDTVADRVRRSLGESSKSVENYDVPIQQATTPSLEALQAYSAGAALNDQGRDQTESLPLFQRAVELDPNFAMAYGQIANDYYNLSEFKLASQNYKKAMDLSASVNAKERLVLQAHYYAEGVGDRLQGIKTYQLWAATYPRESAPAVNIIDSYTQIGQYAPAIAEGELALKAHPENSLIYNTLARACTKAGRFDEALSVGAKAVKNGKELPGLHDSLFQIAIATHDQNAIRRETNWGETHTNGWYAWYFPDLQASAAASAGQYAQAAALYRKSYDVAVRDGLGETSDDILADQAGMEFALGLRAAASATLSRMRKPVSDGPDVALLRAQLGDISFAQKFIAKHASETADTLMANLYLPELRAELAMQRGKPLEAVTDLESAEPYELKDYTVLSERGEAYLQAGNAQAAADQYRKILANPGIAPISPLYPIAHLGLARAYAMESQRSESRAEYEAFFALWKNADADLPVLRQAHLEYAASLIGTRR